LLSRGYRRFGHQLFRPQCRCCQQCISIRTLVREFQPSRSLRRVWRKNAGLRVERQPVHLSDDHLRLFSRYHKFMAAHRGWQRDLISRGSYQESFILGGGDFAFQWAFRDGDRLIAIALMDEAQDAISLVYSFYDPNWRGQSLGTFAILIQLDYAKKNNLRYAYPGYWIEANRSMNYKCRFAPYERLLGHPQEGQAPVWIRA
jgi:arginine-tRNA-protein transferase